MSGLFTVEYWKTTAELVVRSAAIGATSALGGGALSLLTSLSAIAVGQKGSPLVTDGRRI